MRDLTIELIEALEPYDLTMTSWLRLHQELELDEGSFKAMQRAFQEYLEERVRILQRRYGKEACDEGLSKLFGVHDTLIRAGRLTNKYIVDEILVYAAHLAAMSPYGLAVWDRAAKVVLSVAMTTTEKELEQHKRPEIKSQGAAGLHAY